MALAKKISKYLEDRRYKFSLIEHKTAFTAWDRSQTEKVDPRLVAKALVVCLDKEHILALLPSDRQLDKAKLLRLVNTKRKKEKLKIAKKIDLAKEAWMKKHILGKVGAVPPFGALLEMKIFADKLLFKKNKIYVSSGDYNFSLLLFSKEYLKKEEVRLGNFSRKK